MRLKRRALGARTTRRIDSSMIDPALRRQRMDLFKAVVGQRLVRLSAERSAKSLSYRERLAMLLSFDPDQPRDENGRWSSEGGGSNVYRFIGEPDKKVEREIFGKVGVVKDVAAGMVADVESVDFSASVRDTMYGTIEVDLKGEDGSIITRSFSKEDGKLVVDHDEFRRAPETPNFGKDAMRSMMREYERIGVDEVRTITDDTGGYAWARYGFLPDDPSVVAEKISSRLDSHALSYLSASDKAAIRRHIDPSDPKTLWRVADMRMGDRKVGYDILNGMEWRGRLKLSNKAQMKRFKQYVGDKKR